MTETQIEKQRLAKVIGQRFERARCLNQMTQEFAAAQLGYSNGSRLSKIEQARSTVNVPVYIVRRAARLYDVSTDFLLGESDDWEPETPRGSNQFVVELLEKLRKRDLVVMAALELKTKATMETTIECAKAIADVHDALLSFCKNHPEIEDMRASRLISSINRAHSAGKEALARLTRYQSDCTSEAMDVNQLALTLSYDAEEEDECHQAP